MLEIIALVVLCQTMGKQLRRKGRKPVLMQVAVVVCWLGGMVIAAFVYGVILAIVKGPAAAERPGLIVYPVMLLGAVLAEAILFGIVWILPSKVPPPVPGSAVSYDTGMD